MSSSGCHLHAVRQAGLQRGVCSPFPQLACRSASKSFRGKGSCRPGLCGRPAPGVESSGDSIRVSSRRILLPHRSLRPVGSEGAGIQDRGSWAAHDRWIAPLASCAVGHSSRSRNMREAPHFLRDQPTAGVSADPAVRRCPRRSLSHCARGIRHTLWSNGNTSVPAGRRD